MDVDLHKTWPKVSLALGGLLLVLAALWPLLHPERQDPNGMTDEQLLPSQQTTPATGPSATASPKGKSSPTAMPTNLAGAGIGGYTSWQGLKGHSSSESIPKHALTLRLWSSHKLPYVIYNIPTSRDHRAGQETELGTSWSISTTVYGKPDYAQMFTRAGPEGYPITCEITVDGKVTARLTSDGPWGKIFCQG